MSNFIPVEADGVPFYIQVMPAEGQTGIKQRSRDTLTEKLTKDDFKQMIRQAVMPACQTFVDVWQELNQPLTAESAEVEFNLGFTASGSAVIVQASGQASFKVKVSWKFNEPRQIEATKMRMTESSSSFQNDVIRKAQEALEAAVEEDYGASGGISLVPKLSTQIIEQLKIKFLDRENILIWTEEIYVPEQTYLNLKQHTKKSLQSFQDVIADEGGGGVLFLFKPLGEDLDYLNEILRRREQIELGGYGGVVWPP